MAPHGDLNPVDIGLCVCVMVFKWECCHDVQPLFLHHPKESCIPRNSANEYDLVGFEHIEANVFMFAL